jgi:enamidase
MTRIAITNIGELFTGDIAAPLSLATSLLMEDGRIAAVGGTVPDDCDATIDAAGSAVMPGIVDGHVHPMLGEWTPTQDASGWIRNYLHGGTTTMVSAGELHVPGIDYGSLTPELVVSLALLQARTTGRVRWSGVKLHAGTVLLVPGISEAQFDTLARAGTRFAKFIFYPWGGARDEARRYVQQCRARGIRTKVHTGGVSRSGASVVCGFDILDWLQPDIAAHIAGGPIPMSDDDLDRVVDNTTFWVELCSSGNYGSTLRAARRLAERNGLSRLALGTDTPGGTGVIPRGMLRNILFLSSVCGIAPEIAIAVATGNTAKAHGLDVGIIAPGRPADIVVCGRIEGSAGSTVSDAIRHGDIPGISYILADGKIMVDGRSEQTPPAKTAARLSFNRAAGGLGSLDSRP